MKLARFEERWAEAALGAIFPGSLEDGFADIRGMDVWGFLRQVVRAAPARAALGLRLAIWMCALAPLFVLGKLSTLAGLAAAEREKAIGRLAASSFYFVRSLVLILKTMGALLYAGDDAVRARMDARRPKSASLITLRPKPVHVV
jgi:hypothetical protein